jgi:hypothetical protein
MQYSIHIALHGYDGIALVGNNPLPVYGERFIASILRIVGNFVMTGNSGSMDVGGGKREWKMFEEPGWEMLN